MWSQVWVWQIKVFVGWTELDFFNYMYLYVNRLESIVSYKILFSALKHTLLPPEVVMGNLVLLACKAGRSTWQGSYPSVQFSSVTQSYLTLCDPIDGSTAGFPVYHQLPEFTQTHVYWVGDAFQPSHPLSSPFPPAFNLSQKQGLFQGVSCSYQVAKVLEFQLQHQSFQWIFRTNFLEDGLVWSPCSPRDSQESSPTPQFKSINSSVLSLLYVPTLISIHDYWKNHSFD